MTTTVIKLDPTLFQAGERYANLDIRKVRISVGQSDNNGSLNGAALGIKYSRQELDRLTGRAHIQVTINPLNIDSIQVDRWPQYWKLALADLVEKGLVIVERPLDTPLTPTAIRTL